MAQADCKEADDCNHFVISPTCVALQHILIAGMVCYDFDVSKSSS